MNMAFLLPKSLWPGCCTNLTSPRPLLAQARCSNWKRRLPRSILRCHLKKWTVWKLLTSHTPCLKSSVAQTITNPEERVMNIKFNRKKALITGSTGTMGYAIAKGLAETGAWVVLTGRTQERVNSARQYLLQDVPDTHI